MSFYKLYGKALNLQKVGFRLPLVNLYIHKYPILAFVTLLKNQYMQHLMEKSLHKRPRV